MFFFVRFIGCSTVTRLQKDLSDDEVCNDNFIDFEHSPYYLEPNSYLCFQPFTYNGLEYNTFFAFGSFSVINQTHEIQNGIGGSGTRFRIQTYEYGTYISCEFFPAMSFKQQNEEKLKLFKNVDIHQEEYFAFKLKWSGILSSSIIMNSTSISAFIKTINFVPFQRRGMNLSFIFDNTCKQHESIKYCDKLQINNTNDIFKIDSIPSEFDKIDTNNIPHGTFNSSIQINCSWEMDYDILNFYSWYKSIIKYSNNTIYSRDSFDDYLLDGVIRQYDEICHEDYIGPDYLPQTIRHPFFPCFKPFEHKGHYYDTFFVFGESICINNVSSKNPNLWDSPGATGPRFQIRTCNSTSQVYSYFFFSSVESYLPSDIEANIDQYFVFTNNWKGTTSLSYTIKSGKIKSITGKVLTIFSQNPFNLNIKPSNGYVPVLANYENLKKPELNFTNVEQEMTVQNYDCFSWPSLNYDINLADGTYDTSVTTTISPSKDFPEINNGKVYKISNNTVYDDYYTFNDLDLTGPKPEKDVDIIKIVILAVMLPIHIIYCCCCRRKRKSPETLDSSSESSNDNHKKSKSAKNSKKVKNTKKTKKSHNFYEL